MSLFEKLEFSQEHDCWIIDGNDLPLEGMSQLEGYPYPETDIFVHLDQRYDDARAVLGDVYIKYIETPTGKEISLSEYNERVLLGQMRDELQ